MHQGVLSDLTWSSSILALLNEMTELSSLVAVGVRFKDSELGLEAFGAS